MRGVTDRGPRDERNERDVCGRHDDFVGCNRLCCRRWAAGDAKRAAISEQRKIVLTVDYPVTDAENLKAFDRNLRMYLGSPRSSL